MNQKIELNNEEFLVIYQEIASCIRHYSNLRFAVFTVFFGLIGGAFALLSSDKQIPIYLYMGIKLVCLLSSVVFGFFEWRLAREMVHLELQASNIENKLNFELFGHRKRLFIRTPVMTSTIYVGMFIFWLYSLCL